MHRVPSAKVRSERAAVRPGTPANNRVSKMSSAITLYMKAETILNYRTVKPEFGWFIQVRKSPSHFTKRCFDNYVESQFSISVNLIYTIQNIRLEFCALPYSLCGWHPLFHVHSVLFRYSDSAVGIWTCSDAHSFPGFRNLERHGSTDS